MAMSDLLYILEEEEIEQVREVVQSLLEEAYNRGYQDGWRAREERELDQALVEDYGWEEVA